MQTFFSEGMVAISRSLAEVVEERILFSMKLFWVDVEGQKIFNFHTIRLRLVHGCFSGTPFTQQSYKVSDSFPFKWISKKWREGFHVTSMATAGSRWGVVMSRNAGFTDQVNFYALLKDMSFQPC